MKMYDCHRCWNIDILRAKLPVSKEKLKVNVSDLALQQDNDHKREAKSTKAWCYNNITIFEWLPRQPQQTSTRSVK